MKLLLAVGLLLTISGAYSLWELDKIRASSPVEVIVIEKYCNLQSGSDLKVEFQGQTYFVDISREICYRVRPSEALTLYYSTELDEIFQTSKPKGTIRYAVLCIGVILVLFSVTRMVKK